MKAISIKQPWAQLIAQGIKTIELRTWQTTHRGQLLIISSLQPDRNQIKATSRTNAAGAIFCTDVQKDELTGFYHFGRAICTVDLYKIEPLNPEHETGACIQLKGLAGVYAWHLRNPQPVEPVKIKGRLGLFELNMT